MFTLPTMPPVAKGEQVACFVKDRKSVHWSPVMNAMASNDDKGHFVPNGSDNVRHPIMMTNYAQLLILCFYCTDYR